MEIIPLTLMIHRATLNGFAYPDNDASKVRVPITKKSNIRCFIQDTPPEIITWYAQRQERVNESMYMIDKQDFALMQFNDQIVYNGVNYRIKGLHNEAGMGRVFRADLQSEVK